MDVFNPPERQHIIPPPIPTASSTSNNNSTFSPAEQNNNSNNNVTVTIDTKQMQSELERRQQELEIKASELAAREEALRQGGEFRRQHNWPPLPSFCPLKPCFFQDINIDIRPEFQKTVQLGYHLWIGFVFIQMLNIIASAISAANGVHDDGTRLWSGLITFIFVVPLTYMSWFRPLYKAFKNDSSFNFMIFFFIFFMQTFIVSVWSLGISWVGPSGPYNALKLMGTNVFLGIILLLVFASWVAYAVASALYLLKVHSIYRSSGNSMAKARNEFAQGIISNQYVQQTVANAARQTVNQTFSSANTTNNQQQLSGTVSGSR